jgi:Uma2 family endonuclease
MTDAASKPMTVAEFLAWDDGTDTRYGLVCGRVVAMAPVSPDRSINHRVANLGALESGLNRPCYVGIEAGVVRPDRDDTFYEADIVVSCTPLGPGMAVIPDPVVVVEVLSPSTIEHDRGRKAYDYRRIESVQEIVLVSSEQRHVVIWRRRGAKWEVEDLIGDAALELAAVAISIPLPMIYADSGV